jgi:hypothetical protein
MFVVLPFCASIAKASLVSGKPSLSSSGSWRLETWSPSASGGVSAAEHGLVPFATSSALLKPSASSSRSGVFCPLHVTASAAS